VCYLNRLGYLPVKVSIAYTVIGSYAPLFAALVTQKLAKGNFTFFNFRFSWKLLIIGLVVGFVLI
jgi:hypothetical protein